MPTNLPPEYFEIEKRFRQAKSNPEKIACLEEMLSVIPKHKGTDHLRADYRRQLSKLKADSLSPKKTTSHQRLFHIPREGAAQVILVGLTNAGKSALLTALTHAEPEVSEVPYTTWEPTPGMMEYQYVQIQLVDTPSLDREFLEPELIDLIRRADLILVIVDLLANPDQQFDKTIKILAENRIYPDQGAANPPQERFIYHVPVFLVANKCDDESLDEICQVFRELLEQDWPMLSVSALTGRNLGKLKEVLFRQLDLVRVYSKAPGKDPDFTSPFVLKNGGTIEDFAGEIHQDFLKKLKFARVWGSTAFDGQMVQRDYVLKDGDIVELHL